MVDVVSLGTEPSWPFLVAFVKDGNANSIYTTEIVPDVLVAPSIQFSAKMDQCLIHLENQLPKHMVPTVFLPLAWVPLTSTCKTHRRLLRGRAAELTRNELESYVSSGPSTKQAPMTDAEHKLRNSRQLLSSGRRFHVGHAAYCRLPRHRNYHQYAGHFPAPNPLSTIETQLG